MNIFIQERTKELCCSCEKPAFMMTVGLATTFDHKTSDRDATYMLAENVKSVGHNAVVLSRHIVCKKSIEFRKKFAAD